jgi:hypothetical protein
MKTTILLLLAILALVVPITAVKAASIGDMQPGPNSTNTSQSGTIGGDTPQTSNSMIVTAVPEKGEITKGAAESITVKAVTDNGTGIPDVNIASIVIDYASQSQKVLLGGQTDAKGELVLTTQIGPHAHAGQYLVTVTAQKDGLDKQNISTGFAVTEKGSGSGSDSPKDSKGNCSGATCK